MRLNRCGLAASCIGLVMLCPPALGASAEPGSPGQAPAEVARRHLVLQAGDGAIVDAALRAPARYAATPGVQEFTGELIVRPRREILGVSRAAPGTLRRALDRVGPLIVRKAELTHEYLVRVPEGMSENELSSVLMATGDYEYAEPNWMLWPADTTPNDPQFGSSWQHSRLQSAAAWDLETGNSSVIVAVCDTGVDQDHPDLQAALVSGYNARSRLAQADGGEVDDINGHGTFVAGCAAAIGNNGTGVVGAGWGFSVMPIRVTNRASGGASAFDILNGARWAADNGARIINASYSGGTSSSIQAAALEIKAMGGLLFYAAGNDNNELPDVDRPDYVIVASTTSSDNKSGFSNYGPPIDVAAPGSGVRSTRIGGSYGNGSGTSYASPIAAGVGAMITAARPDLHPTDIQDILYAGADDLGAPGEDDLFGHGRVNTFNSVTIAQTWIARIPLPIDDGFESAAIDAEVWTGGAGGEVVDDNGSGALVLDGSDSIESAGTHARSLSGLIGVLTFTARHEGVEAGESLVVEYLDAADQWQTALVMESDGTDQAAPEAYEYAFGQADLRNGLRVRFRAEGSDGSDDWFIDDVFLGEFAGATLPLADDFESGSLSPTRWGEVVGAGVAEGGVGGSRAMRIEASESATTALVSGSVFPESLYLSYSVRGEGVPEGESLLVEHRTLLGTYDTIDEVVSDGTDGAFEARVVELPILALISELDIRFSHTGQAETGSWWVDDMLLATQPAPSACPADLAEPIGVLDFSDVLAFLAAFGAGEPEADLAEPFGVLDFSDVLAFLQAFGEGCP